MRKILMALVAFTAAISLNVVAAAAQDHEGEPQHEHDPPEPQKEMRLRFGGQGYTVSMQTGKEFTGIQDAWQACKAKAEANWEEACRADAIAHVNVRRANASNAHRWKDVKFWKTYRAHIQAGGEP